MSDTWLKTSRSWSQQYFVEYLEFMTVYMQVIHIAVFLYFVKALIVMSSCIPNFRSLSLQVHLIRSLQVVHWGSQCTNLHIISKCSINHVHGDRFNSCAKHLAKTNEKTTYSKLGNLEKGFPQDKAAPLMDKLVFSKVYCFILLYTYILFLAQLS